MIQIVVASGRRVRPECGFVARHGGRHAEPRIGVDIVGADQALGEFVEHVVILGHQLAGDIKTDAIGPVLGDGFRKFFGKRVERNIPIHPLAIFAAAAPHFGMQCAAIRRGRLMKCCALGAQPTEVCRVIRVAAHVGDANAVRLREHTATHAAVRAGGFDFSH